ncbi:MAG: pirin family protein [Candidatus Binataceae bacterium]
MITIRKADERGHTALGWLDSRHSFSFGDYYDRHEMGFSSLRVINDDRIGPRGGFPSHPHRDMEIVTYVLAGALEHRDSLGNGSIIRPGEVQRMSAGTGVIHSEYNPSATDPLHLLQIWITPRERGAAPGYEQKPFDDAELRGRLRLVGSPEGRDGSVTIHQDAWMYAGIIDHGGRTEFAMAPGRSLYLQMARGAVNLNGKALTDGDGARITNEPRLEISAASESEVLLFDLA